MTNELNAADDGQKYRESDNLTNIDGFLVADGGLFRVTVRSNLSLADKEQGYSKLVNSLHIKEHPKEGVYLWAKSKE